MNLDSVRFENFRSHVDLELTLRDVRCAAIVGRNGAGKSSILEGIDWCLYGGQSGDDLLRHGSDKGGVTVELADGAQHWRISRGRQRNRKSWLHVEVGPEGGAFMPKDFHTIAESEAFILRHVVGMDHEAFRASVYTPQGEAGYLASLTPGDRKALLGALLGLESYEEWRGVAAEEARAVGGRLAVVQETVQTRTDEVFQLGNPQERHDDLGRQRAAQDQVVKHIEADIDKAHARERIREQVERRRGVVSQMNDLVRRKKRSEEISSKRAGLQTTLRNGQHERAALAELEGARQKYNVAVAEADAAQRGATEANKRAKGLAAEAQGRYAALELRYRTARDEQASARGELDDLKPKDACPTCGQAIEGDDFERVKSSLEQRLMRLTSEVEALDSERDSAREARDSAKAEAERQSALVTATPEVELDGYDPKAYEAAREAVRALDRTEAVLEALEDPEDVEELRAAHGTLKAELAELPSEVPDGLPLEELRVRLEAQKAKLGELVDAQVEAKGDVDTLARLTGEIAQGKSDAAALEARKDALEVVVRAFSRNGIPAMILDNAVRGIEDAANDVLGQLETAMRLQLVTQRLTKGKKLSETLQIIVDDGTVERPLESFSGGERYRVHLALRMGLAAVLASQTGRQIGFMLIDEPTDLDQEGMTGVSDLLTRLDRQILLVTHQAELVTAMPQRITVERPHDAAPSSVTVS